MRHRKLKGKLNRTASHRKALFTNMAQSLIEHEQITTTVIKAKALKPIVEKLVTVSKDTTKTGSLHSRRILLSRLGSKSCVDKLIDVLALRYKDRAGGYTRIIKSGFRYGDNAPMAIIEFVDRDVSAKGAKDIEFFKAKKKLEEEGLLENQAS